MEDYERSRRPKEATTDGNVEFVHSLIMCGRRRSLRDIARQIGISFGEVKHILIDILGFVQSLSRVGHQKVDQRSEEEQA